MGSGGRRWEALASGVPCLPLQSGPGPRTPVAAQFCSLGRCLRPAADLTTLGLGTRLSQSCAVSCRPGPRSSDRGYLALCLSIPHLGALPPCWTLASSTQGPLSACGAPPPFAVPALLSAPPFPFPPPRHSDQPVHPEHQAGLASQCKRTSAGHLVPPGSVKSRHFGLEETV